MRARIGQLSYKIPPISRIEQIFIEGNQKYNQMYSSAIGYMSMEEFLKLDTNIQGRPTLCAINHTASKIYFWPVPDKPYEIKVRYYSPVKEF